jgi:PTS system nitrogen regulatory IIA component
MDLKTADVAEMLHVSEETVCEWSEEGHIPAYRMDTDGEYRFNRLEVEDWVMKHKLGEKQELAPSDAASAGSQRYSLYRALHHGTVLHDVPGESKEEIIAYVTQELAQQVDADPQVLTELLLDREALMPTALANGVGVPHTRDHVVSSHLDYVTVAFPRQPIEYGALDNLPVHTLFFLFASGDKRHLHLLAKIAHLASNPDGLKLLQSQPSKSELMAFVRGWEGQIMNR